MAGLKALVIIMGIAIIVAATVLVTVMVQRAGDLAAGGGQAAAPAAVSSGAAPGHSRIDLPAGARVVDSDIDGGRILLRIALVGGGERLLVIDAATGQRLAVHELGAKDGAR